VGVRAWGQIPPFDNAHVIESTAPKRMATCKRSLGWSPLAQRGGRARQVEP
jgi:hypothetical protein